jgi:3-deoxy-D-manno-octulosonic-acid transferase
LNFNQYLYNAALWCAQPLLRRKLARRALAEPLYGEAVAERFGHYTQAAELQSDLVWVHAVSLGETRAAEVLIKALRQALPSMRLLLTHGTATGRAEGARLLQAGDVQVWQPWDTPAAVQRFLLHFKPRVGVLIETEVWPNLVLQSQKLGVPLALANARMSEQSTRKALRWPALTRPVYQALRAVWPQTQADSERLQQLGATAPKVLGNIKFDAQPDAAQCAQGQAWREVMKRPVAMLASSREGEEEAWLQAVMAQLEVHAQGHIAPEVQNKSAPAVQWLIVPRHPQRVYAVEALLLSQGWRVSRRSQWFADGPLAAEPQTKLTVWLGDSLGEMALYYSLADVALLGGSFAPLGGQNLIEAAACGCPVIMGPHTFNFAQASEMAEQTGAALRVGDMAQAITQTLSLLSDAAQLQRRATQAQAFAQAHQGAALRTAQAVAQLLQ